MKSKFLRFGLFFLIALAPGCSRLEWSMKFADTLALYTLTDYFELSGEQRDQVRKAFHQNLHQIQKKNFVQLAAHLEGLALAVEKKEFTPEAFVKFSKELEDDIRRAVQSFEPLGQQVVEAEAAHDFKTFDAKFLSKLADDEKEVAQSPDKILKRDLKKAQTLIDESVDYLTDAQKTELESTLRKFPPPQKLQIESRKLVFEKFKKARVDAKTRALFVKDFFMKWESFQTSEYLAARTAYRKELEALCQRIYATLNEEQRSSFVKHLRKRAKELRSIAAKAA